MLRGGASVGEEAITDTEADDPLRGKQASGD